MIAEYRRRLPFGMNRRLAELQQSLHAEVASKISPSGPLDIAPLDIENPLIDLDCSGNYLLCSHADGHVRMYRLRMLTPEPSLIGRSESHAFSRYSPPVTMEWFPTDNKLFITADKLNRMNIWDASLMAIIDDFPVQANALTHNICPVRGGESLVADDVSVGLMFQGTNIYDMRTGTRVDMLRLPSPSGNLIGDVVVSWSPVQRHLLVTSEKKRHPVIWDTRFTRRPLKQLRPEMRFSRRKDDIDGPSTTVTVIGGKFTTDGRRYIVLYGNKRVTVWNLPAVELAFQHHMHGLLNPPYSEQLVRFETGEEQRFTKGLLFYPVQNTVQIFSFEKKAVVASHEIHLDSINACILRRGRNQLVTSSYDSTCHILSA